MSRPIEIQWRRRDVPLAPAAVVAHHAATGRLVQRLFDRDPEALERLEGAATDRTIVLVGAMEDLPWADGVTYLGRDPSAPALLLPTRLEPNVPAALLAKAIGQRDLGALVAVLLDPPRLMPLDGTRRVSHTALARWREVYG